MSNAFMCDRCGEYGDGKPAAFFKFPNPYQQGLTDSDQRTVRLCEDCQKDLTAFMGQSLADDPLDSVLDSLETVDVEWSWDETVFRPDWLVQDTSTVLEEQVESGGRNY